MNGPVPVLPGQVGAMPHITVGAPGRKIRVAIFPVSPPGGAVPSVPLSVHPTPAGRTGCACRNGTARSEVPLSDCVACDCPTFGATTAETAPVEGGAALGRYMFAAAFGLAAGWITLCFVNCRCASANGIAHT